MLDVEEWVRRIAAATEEFFVTTGKPVRVYTASPNVWTALWRAVDVRELTSGNVSPDMPKGGRRLCFLGVEIELDATLPPDSLIPHAEAGKR